MFSSMRYTELTLPLTLKACWSSYCQFSSIHTPNILVAGVAFITYDILINFDLEVGPLRIWYYDFPADRPCKN